MRKAKKRMPGGKSGQFINPHVNELEWIDETEMDWLYDSGKKLQVRNRAPKLSSVNSIKPKKRGEPNARMREQAKSNRRVTDLTGFTGYGAAQPAPPLLFLHHFLSKRKPDPVRYKDDLMDERLFFSEVPMEEITEEADAAINNEFAESETASNAEEAECLEGGELQQYGLISFEFTPDNEVIDITVNFEEPFEEDQYVLVATTNQAECYAVVCEKTRGAAVIRIIRNSLSPFFNGVVNWIAFGKKTSRNEVSQWK
jgi:hypothetical protein